MTDKATILDYLKIYLRRFPNEAGRSAIFSGFMQETPGELIYARKNFGGHITTSGFIIDPGHSEILLLKHKSLNRWLQPGGHVEESDDSPLASALRECAEETAIAPVQLLHLSLFDPEEVPFDIDSHYIPPNPKKNEDGHYHHDLRYVFVYNGDGQLRFNSEESTGLKWVKFAALANDATFSEVIRKISECFKSV